MLGDLEESLDWRAGRDEGLGLNVYDSFCALMMSPVSLGCSKYCGVWQGYWLWTAAWLDLPYSFKACIFVSLVLCLLYGRVEWWDAALVAALAPYHFVSTGQYRCWR